MRRWSYILEVRFISSLTNDRWRLWVLSVFFFLTLMIKVSLTYCGKIVNMTCGQVQIILKFLKIHFEESSGVKNMLQKYCKVFPCSPNVNILQDNCPNQRINIITILLSIILSYTVLQTLLRFHHLLH